MARARKRKKPTKISTESIRDRIVKEAQSWIGTPYHHQALIKGRGCDCAGIIKTCARVAGIEYLENWDYGRIPHPPTLLGILNRYLERISLAEIRPGDVICFRIVQDPCHLAIYTVEKIVHAYAKTVRAVVEHELTEEWRQRIVAIYRFPGVD